MKTKIKTPQEIRAKKAQLKLKNSIRVVGKTPEKEKRGPTGELELFKKIAFNQSINGFVQARHLTKEGQETYKMIRLEDLTVSNMSHKIPKSRGEEYRLDPENIEIVSTAWHLYEHTRQILQIDVPN